MLSKKLLLTQVPPEQTAGRKRFQYFFIIMFRWYSRFTLQIFSLFADLLL